MEHKRKSRNEEAFNEMSEKINTMISKSEEITTTIVEENHKVVESIEKVQDKIINIVPDLNAEVVKTLKEVQEVLASMRKFQEDLTNQINTMVSSVDKLKSPSVWMKLLCRG